MRKNFLFLFITTLLSVVSLSVMADNPQTASCKAQRRSLTSYVNQYIGTGGHGHEFMGANVPFGLVQAGPTEYTRGWDWCSGYHYSDSVLIGFGQMHLSGTGIGCLGDIALLPVADFQQHEAVFSHSNEVAHPGYYSVSLTNPRVRVELTATERVAFHRYTFADVMAQPRMIIDLSQCIGWDKMTDCAFTDITPTRIVGYRRSTGWAKDRRIYFCIDFSQAVTVEAIDAEGNSGGENAGTTEKPCRMKLTIEGARTQPLLVKVALSPTSEQGAIDNMKAELSGWDFDATVEQADEKWEQALHRIVIDTPNETVKTVFYSSMYRLMTAPSLFCDADKQYRGSDGEVHQGTFFNYTTLSLWDTYRAAHPLMSLIAPEMQGDFVNTFIQIFKEGGKLPVWHLMGNETDCMVGNPGVIVLSDLVLKGYAGNNAEQAYQAMKQSVMLDEREMNLLKQYGYLPYDKTTEPETVAKGLEYAIADQGVARVAKMLGHTDDAQYFAKRAQSYKYYFDRRSQFMRGIDSKGKFRPEFNPIQSIHRQNDYTEGNAWQYTWLVPHDVHGLVKLFGGEKSFTTKLDSLFVVTGDLGEQASPDVSGLIGMYAHGNEPSHHILYLYNYVGQPYKGARLIRQVMNEMYRNDIDGYCGNGDVGQMAAWYVLSAIGLYEVDPSSGIFIIGSPIVDSAKVNIGSGKTLTVKTVGNSDKNIYVKSVTLNGKSHPRSYLTWSEIQQGGELVLTMTDQPSAWGTKKTDRP